MAQGVFVIYSFKEYIENYVKFILQEGSISEQRELIGCIKGDLLVAKKEGLVGEEIILFIYSLRFYIINIMTDKQIDSYEKYQDNILNLFYEETSATNLVKNFLQNKIPLVKFDPEISFCIFENKKHMQIEESQEKNKANIKRLNENLQKLEKIQKEQKQRELFIPMLISVAVVIIGISIYLNNYFYLYLFLLSPMVAAILANIFQESDKSEPVRQKILDSDNFKYVKNLLLSRINHDIAQKAVFEFNDINLETTGKKLPLPEKEIKWTENELKAYFFVHAGYVIKQLNSHKKDDDEAVELLREYDFISEDKKYWTREERRKDAIIRLSSMAAIYGYIHQYFLNIDQNKKINTEFNFMKKNNKNSSNEAKSLIEKYLELKQKSIIESKYFAEQLLSISEDFKLNQVLKTYIN